MKIFVLLLLAFVSLKADTISIKHKFYSTIFDTVKHYPVFVKWTITKKMLTCPERLERQDKFLPDPKLKRSTSLSKDYSGSGYDRGHNMNAYDNGCDSIGMKESFYYSNMTPQSPSLNRGDWKTLEEYTRRLVAEFDTIKVACGSIGNLKKVNSLVVPTKCWKVIYIRKLKKYEAFIFENNSSKSNGINDNRTTCANITKLTGFQIIGKFY
jgi:endonuclease G, mitochondrial